MKSEHRLPLSISDHLSFSVPVLNPSPCYFLPLHTTDSYMWHDRAVAAEQWAHFITYHHTHLDNMLPMKYSESLALQLLGIENVVD